MTFKRVLLREGMIVVASDAIGERKKRKERVTDCLTESLRCALSALLYAIATALSLFANIPPLTAGTSTL